MTYLPTYLVSQLDSQLSAETEVYWDMNHYHIAIFSMPPTCQLF